jgi:hypothetical protein
VEPEVCRRSMIELEGHAEEIETMAERMSMVVGSYRKKETS